MSKKIAISMLFCFAFLLSIFSIAFGDSEKILYSLQEQEGFQALLLNDEVVASSLSSAGIIGAPQVQPPRPFPPQGPGRRPMQSSMRRFAYGARLSYHGFSDDELEDATGTIDVEFDEGVGFGLNFTQMIAPYFSAEFSIDFIVSELDFSTNSVTENIGDLMQIPLAFTARFHLPGEPVVSPYFGAGAGYYFNYLDSNRTAVATIYGQGGNIDLDDSFGFHVAGGVEFFTLPWGAFTVDLKYVWSEADIEIYVPNVGNDEIELNQFVVGLGYKMYF